VKLFGFLNTVTFKLKQKVEIRKRRTWSGFNRHQNETDHWYSGEKSKDVHGYVLAEELEAVKTFHPSRIIKPHALFQHLAVNNRFTGFSNVLLLIQDLLSDACNSHLRWKRFFKPKNN